MNKSIRSFLLKIYAQLSYKIKLGENSRIQTGCIIEGGKNITIGDNSFIGKNTWIACYEKYLSKKYKPSIKIGNNVSIGKYGCITAINSVSISDGCLISEHFYTSDHVHGFNPGVPPAKQNLESKGPVFIGENCFIGYRVSILPGVTIGRSCVIGSHTVVTKDIPDYSMAVGSPARVIKKFDFPSNEWVHVTN